MPRTYPGRKLKLGRTGGALRLGGLLFGRRVESAVRREFMALHEARLAHDERAHRGLSPGSRNGSHVVT